MTHSGITEEQVFQAAASLAQANKPVSITAVRDVLGGAGSYTTINRLLSDWRSQQGMSESVIPTLPPEVEQVMAAAAQSIWRAAAAHAQRTVEEMRHLTQQQLTQQEAELAEAHHEIARLEEKSRLDAEAGDRSRQNLNAAAVEIAEARSEIALLQERTAQLEERLGEHQTQLTRLQEELERERGAATKARQEAEEARLALAANRDEVQEARRDIARLEEETLDQAEALTQARAETQSALERSEQAAAESAQASQARQHSEHQLERLQDKYSQSQAEVQRLLHELDDERQRLRQSEAALAERRETLATVKAERDLEERRAESLAEQLAQLQNQLIELVSTEREVAATSAAATRASG
jgi:chromosome segregation ATPase